MWLCDHSAPLPARYLHLAAAVGNLPVLQLSFSHGRLSPQLIAELAAMASDAGVAVRREELLPGEVPDAAGVTAVAAWLATIQPGPGAAQAAARDVYTDGSRVSS